MLSLVMSSLALNLFSLNYKSASYQNESTSAYIYQNSQDTFFNSEELYLLGISTLQSKEGDVIQFKKPLTFRIKKEDGLFLLEWTEDKDVFGMGETIDEAQEDLLYNIEGILAMKNFDENKLSEESKELLDKLTSKIEEIKQS